MTAQAVIVILAVGLAVSIAVIFVITAYFMGQWRKLDRILDEFHRGSYDNTTGVMSGYKDMAETRESRVISQLEMILAGARFRERHAVGEKDRIVELISDLSHQIRTPLANIVMNIELLQDVSPDEGQRAEFLERTKCQADKLQWLTDNLLKASKLENGMIRFSAGMNGIKGTIAKAVSSVYAQASVKNIELSVEEFADFDLYHNPKWTAEAMTNILENGVKYAPAGSRIHIALCRMDIYTKIMISDEGIGIPEKEYHMIFKRFYRSSAVEQQEGSGLGLYLAQLIAQCEKGYITVASEVGKGSCFSLFLLNEAV